jgi:hypothetical protein
MYLFIQGMKNPVYLGQKNHNIPAYIDAALRIYRLGLPMDNDEFVKVVKILRKQNRRWYNESKN